jgi:RND family efflux transporter MFP subunit
MSGRSKIWGKGTAMAGATALLFGFAFAADAIDAATPQAPPSPAPGAVLSMEHSELRAQLSPRNYTTLAAEINAKISRITTREGQSFRAGQTLVTFDCSLEQAQQAKAKAEAAAAQQLYEANSRLAELNSVGRLELATSASQLDEAHAELAYVTGALGKCSIVAPFNGRVAEQKAREQQFVQAGQALLDILDDSALELEFIVPSKWLLWLKAGQAFNVAIDETGRTYPARVTRLGARVDPVSQSIKAAAIIEGHFPELIAGMSGHLNFSPPLAQR